jgi:pimeloyl-ACP methyl ester carboxylesterase
MDQPLPNADHVVSPGGVRLAYRRRAGSQPTLLFLPGYASDMDGAKALALDRHAAALGTGLVRFDYSGTGLSGGSFHDGTLGGWLDEALFIAEALVDGPIILVGSSMGAWIALHVALRMPARVAGLVGIAAAPDFTDWGFTAEQKAELSHQGRIERSSPQGGDAQLTTSDFWRSGQDLRLLGEPIGITCPVRLVHGDADGDVPLPVAMRLMQCLRSADVQLNIIKGGAHRLSEPHEIAAILRAVGTLLEPLQ